PAPVAPRARESPQAPPGAAGAGGAGDNPPCSAPAAARGSPRRPLGGASPTPGGAPATTASASGVEDGTLPGLDPAAGVPGAGTDPAGPPRRPCRPRRPPRPASSLPRRRGRAGSG